MGRKRADRENMVHKRAVAIRKMTDDQLCSYVDNLYMQGLEAGRESGNNMVQKFLEHVKNSKVSGFGVVTLNKLQKVASDNGYI